MTLKSIRLGPKMYMFPNEHLKTFCPVCHCLPATLSLRQGRPSDALKLASTNNPLVELAPESSGRMEASSFEQLHSCCENIALAITNLRGLTNSKDISFALLASFMASGICGVLFGPLQARYCPPTGAAQIISMLKALIDRDFSLPSENFWTHNHIS
ncbi:uncharacterized protein PGTG_16858 [Puccinia graminis f. sp. tritici CRL 75-36-700-3]|uniref:Uncharacterized protein n=1 Tax=Puccinia graminis f. sp. tritici (strain CRL 75-36-700-3 / race SCCL) TaxID=418459 RepID=E3L3I8_PUCGT|nr:uncharacterized protein PGTG_16858 [Puccinia graminis f. sp. tritici CRL 75-36-700-3]EFP91113.2 hypothetical protein PGTG_16858 [Puccinia graminis f. sp. tritici CRL 75-36-700-3]